MEGKNMIVLILLIDYKTKFQKSKFFKILVIGKIKVILKKISILCFDNFKSFEILQSFVFEFCQFKNYIGYIDPYLNNVWSTWISQQSDAVINCDFRFSIDR